MGPRPRTTPRSESNHNFVQEGLDSTHFREHDHANTLS